ncbi:MAG: hypothetical protein ACLFMT_03030 [Halobacteriales archaeon]
MTDDEIVPGVPDVRGRNIRRLEDEAEVDGESIQEEMDALQREVPFVPIVAKRRDQRLRDVRVGRADD